MADEITNLTGGQDQEQYLSSNIEDYLLSLAESLQLVQKELNQRVVRSTGDLPAIRYQLPKLEFELKMSIEMAQASQSGSRGQLLARPINVFNQSSRENAAEAASTIRGSFVAVPMDGGKPPAVLQTYVTRTGDWQWQIDVEVRSAVGQQLDGVEVEFNVNPDESARLSQGEGLTISLSPQTNLWHGLLTTQNGRVTNVLEASPAELRGTLIVVQVDALGQSETMIFPVEPPASGLTSEVKALYQALKYDWFPTDDEIFAFTSVEDLQANFQESLSSDLTQLLEANPNLLNDPKLQAAFNEEYAEYRTKVLSTLRTALTQWDTNTVFSEVETMKTQFFAEAEMDERTRALQDRTDILEDPVITEALKDKLSDLRNTQSNKVLMALNRWSPAEGVFFRTTDEMRAAFTDTLTGVEREIADQEAIWSEERLRSLLLEKHYRAVKDALIDDIKSWPMGDNQKESSRENVQDLIDTYFARDTETVNDLRVAVNQLREAHRRELLEDVEVALAFQQKYDSIQNEE